MVKRIILASAILLLALLVITELSSRQASATENSVWISLEPGTPGSEVWQIGANDDGVNVYSENDQATHLLVGNDGRIGIGTTSPTESLEVVGNITASGTICDSVGCIGSGAWNANGPDVYYDNGNVGIGTSNPQHLLGFTTGGIAPAVSTDLNFVQNAYDTTGWKYMQSGIRASRLLLNNGWLEFFNANESVADDPISWGNAKFVINTAGDVGIGVSSPSERLDVQGTAVFRVDEPLIVGNSYGYTGMFGNNENVGGSPLPGLWLSAANVNPTNSAFIGISSSLADAGTEGDIWLRAGHFPGNGMFGKIQLETNGGSMVVANDGNVGIGTTTPTARLHAITNSTDTAPPILGGYDYTVDGTSAHKLLTSEAWYAGYPGVAGVSRQNSAVNIASLDNYGGVGVVGASGGSTGGRVHVGVYGYAYFNEPLSGNSGNRAQGGYFLSELSDPVTDFNGTLYGIRAVADSTAGISTGGTVYGVHSQATGETNNTVVGGYFSATGGTNNYGLLVGNGNVGINGGKLTVQDNQILTGHQDVAAPSHSFHDVSNSGMTFISAAQNSRLSFVTAGTERVSVNYSSGNMGIGTATPQTRLHINGGKLTVQDNQILTGHQSPSAPGHSFHDIPNSGMTFISAAQNSRLSFVTAGTERVSVNYLNGKVGIGTTNPTRTLHTYGSGSQFIRVETTEDNQAGIEFFRNGFDWRIMNDGAQLFFESGEGGGAFTPSLTMNSNDVQVSNYIQLALTTGAPPASDCDAASEKGRMKVDSVAGVLYICVDSGWVIK